MIRKMEDRQWRGQRDGGIVKDDQRAVNFRQESSTVLNCTSMCINTKTIH